jgi:hypothetical protein
MFVTVNDVKDSGFNAEVLSFGDELKIDEFLRRSIAAASSRLKRWIKDNYALCEGFGQDDDRFRLCLQAELYLTVAEILPFISASQSNRENSVSFDGFTIRSNQTDAAECENICRLLADKACRLVADLMPQDDTGGMVVL